MLKKLSILMLSALVSAQAFAMSGFEYYRAMEIFKNEGPQAVGRYLSDLGNQGDDDAMYMLAHLNATHNIEKIPSNRLKQSVVNTLTTAASLGNNKAYLWLGSFTLYGYGEATGPRVSYYWFNIAANSGLARGKLLAGQALADGKGVTRDVSRAKRLIYEAAGAGDIQASAYYRQRWGQPHGGFVYQPLPEDFPY